MQVDMVNVDANFLNEPIRMKFPHLADGFAQVLFYTLHEDFSTVSRYPDYMVLRLVYTMRLAMKFHAYIISYHQQDAAPCSHPHPYRWGTPANLDYIEIASPSLSLGLAMTTIIRIF